MRSKEFANDYRYFPEPDLLPVVIEQALINNIKDSMPELPQEKKERFIEEYDLTEYESGILSSDKDLANFFDELVKTTNKPKISGNWVIGELSAFLNKGNLNIQDSKVDAKNLGNLNLRIEDKTKIEQFFKKAEQIDKNYIEFILNKIGMTMLPWR